MADGRHVGKYWKYHSLPSNGQIGTKPGWSHPITFSTYAIMRLPTAHWTFSSYGRLEAKRVNQFWWNLVYNSKFGQQWQSRDQIFKKIKFKMADGRCWKIFEMPLLACQWLGCNLGGRNHHVPNIGNAITCFTMRPIGTTLGWSRDSRPSNTSAAKPFPWYWSLLLTARWTFWFYGVYRSKTSIILMKLEWLCHCGTKEK